MSDSKKYPFRSRRFPLRLAITQSTVSAFLDSEIMNLSKGGVFIHSDITLPLGSEVDFEFTLSSLNRVIKATGIVVWTRKGGARSPSHGFPDHPAGMGIQFKEIRMDDLDFILEELERISRNS